MIHDLLTIFARPRRDIVRLAAIVCVVALALAATGCGDDDGDNGGEGTTAATGKGWTPPKIRPIAQGQLLRDPVKKDQVRIATDGDEWSEIKFDLQETGLEEKLIVDVRDEFMVLVLPANKRRSLNLRVVNVSGNEKQAELEIENVVPAKDCVTTAVVQQSYALVAVERNTKKLTWKIRETEQPC